MPRLTMLFLRILSMLSRRARHPHLTFRGPGELTYLLDLKRLRILPPMAGADDDDEDEDESEEEAADESEEGAADESEEDESEEDESEDDDVDEDALPDKVKAVLKKERKARRDAERKLREATGKPKPKAPPKKPAKKADDEPDDEPTGPDAGTVKLRSANLLIALTAKGYEGQRAKVVAKLLDDVEFGDDDEPVDLDGALEDAEERWGTEMFVKGDKKKPKPKAPGTGGKDKGDDDDTAKPRLTADELAMAKSFGMTPREYAAYKVGDIPDPPKPKKSKK